MNILIVDDSAVARFHLQSLLNDAGFSDIVPVASAADAFQRLGLGTPDGAEAGEAGIDLILMDALMPGLDGVAACRQIKAAPHLRDIPLIMVTAQSEMEHLAAAFSAGAMDYITKPAEPVELLARVRSALKLKREMDQRKARDQEADALLARAETAEQALEESNRRLTELRQVLAVELRSRQQEEEASRQLRHA
jgi:CheY-like chemotaxis protein